MFYYFEVARFMLLTPRFALPRERICRVTKQAFPTAVQFTVLRVFFDHGITTRHRELKKIKGGTLFVPEQFFDLFT